MGSFWTGMDLIHNDITKTKWTLLRYLRKFVRMTMGRILSNNHISQQRNKISSSKLISMDTK